VGYEPGGSTSCLGGVVVNRIGWDRLSDKSHDWVLVMCGEIPRFGEECYVQVHCR